MRLAGYFLVGAVLVCACRPSGATTQPTDADGQPDGSDIAASEKNEPGDGGAQAGDAPTCAEGGQAWDGHHPQCLHEVAGCCYDNPAAACAAASCTNETCRIMEFSPAQIVCESPTTPAQS